MAQKTKIRKYGKFILRFLRLFPPYREMETAIQKKEEARQLSAAIIQSYRSDEAKLLKQIESDAAVIVSLNRYITALEGKADMQSEMLRELNQKLKALHPRKKRGGQNE